MHAAASVSIFHPLHIVGVECHVVRGARVSVARTIARRIWRPAVGRMALSRVTSLHVCAAVSTVQCLEGFERKANWYFNFKTLES